jgi:hypothetical protein
MLSDFSIIPLVALEERGHMEDVLHAPTRCQKRPKTEAAMQHTTDFFKTPFH